VKGPRDRTPLTRDRILRAALAIADREGLAAISMRRIGEALGVEAMSIYNHVANKAAVLDGIFETVLGELPAAEPPRSWQTALQDRARALRAVLRTHPHVLPLFATRPAVTPASLTQLEAALTILRRAGFTVEHALLAFQSLFAFVLGHTIAAYSPRSSGEAAHPAYAALSKADYPHLVEAAAVLDRYDFDREFELGLEAMVLGLGAQRARRRRARADARSTDHEKEPRSQ
jgi:AcrR family transcriptional regulator